MTAQSPQMTTKQKRGGGGLRVGNLAVFAALLLVALAAIFIFSSSHKYLDLQRRFSFALPRGATTEDFRADDNSSETLIIKSGAEVVQLSISSQPQSIANQLPPDATPASTTVAGVSGLTFVASNGTDVWFSSGNYLYQLVEFDTSTTLLDSVTAHWIFLRNANLKQGV